MGTSPSRQGRSKQLTNRNKRTILKHTRMMDKSYWEDLKQACGDNYFIYHLKKTLNETGVNH